MIEIKISISEIISLMIRFNIKRIVFISDANNVLKAIKITLSTGEDITINVNYNEKMNLTSLELSE